MNTPSHYIVNFVLLGKNIGTEYKIPIIIGAILPDIPIFIFYFLAKFIFQIPNGKIWSEAYYEPFWQDLIAIFHSIPIAIIGLFICLGFGWRSIAMLFMSMIIHDLCDLPVHHDDAHRHFFPFSNYRFMSPISYWDPKHYGKYVAFGEMSLVVTLTPIVLPLLSTNLAQIIVIAIDCLYLVGYLRFYIF